MYNKLTIYITNFATALIAGLLINSCDFTQQTLPGDAGSDCASGSQALTAAEFNTWFESGSVSLNGAVKPANSILFPNIPNCTFYKWSEQMFLWLTSPAPPRYGGNGLVMNTPAFFDISLPDENGIRHFLPHTSGQIRAFNLRNAQKGVLDLDVILERKSLKLLEIIPPVMSASGKQLVLDRAENEREIGSIRLNEKKTPVLFDVSGNEILGPKAILQSPQDTTPLPFMRRLRRLENFDRTSLVAKLVSDKNVVFLDSLGNFHETEQGQADGSVLLAQNGSLVYYSLTVNNVFMLYRTMQGTTVPNNTKFPLTQADIDAITNFAVAHGQSPVIDSIALAIEIKSSWVEAAGLTDVDKFIKMKAIVPTYDKSNPNEWVPNGTKTIELAMVGMHVVGSTKGHPELLWGTFEHVSNDPAAEYTYRNNSNSDTTIPQPTSGTWVFCSSGATSTSLFNQSHMFMDGDHIKAVPGQTISPTDIRREKPWGLNGSASVGNAQVISTNNKVRSLLQPDDVRRNYIQTGTTWTIGGASPNGNNQVGTSILANTTMETFTQGQNCFSCHFTNTTTVSHVFNDTAPLF